MIEGAAALVARAPDRDFGAFTCGVGDVLLDFLQARLIDQRPLGHPLLQAEANLEAKYLCMGGV